jgi:hypothetical protein
MKKLFKIIGSIILILISGSSIYICEYSTTGRTTKKSRNTDKIQAPSIKQLVLPPPFLLAEKSPLSLGQKTQLSSSRVG